MITSLGTGHFRLDLDTNERSGSTHQQPGEAQQLLTITRIWGNMLGLHGSTVAAAIAMRQSWDLLSVPESTSQESRPDVLCVQLSRA
jgi:hypothetical protein